MCCGSVTPQRPLTIPVKHRMSVQTLIIRWHDLALPRETLLALLRFALAVLIGASGGFLADRAGIPAGWLSGSLIASAVASSLGLHVRIPALLVQIMFILLGMTIGASVTPETLATMRQWPVAFITLLLSMALVTVAVIAYLRRFENYDKQTAFFSAIPGALSMVLAMTLQSQANLRMVLVTQTVRIVVLIAFLPAFIKMLGFAPMTAPVVTPSLFNAPAIEYVVLIGASCLAALAAMAVRFPGAPFSVPCWQVLACMARAIPQP